MDIEYKTGKIGRDRTGRHKVPYLRLIPPFGYVVFGYIRVVLELEPKIYILTFFFFIVFVSIACLCQNNPTIVLPPFQPIY